MTLRFDPTRYRAYLFDMDGTLLDSMKYWRQVSVDFLAARGLPAPDEVRADIMDISSRVTAQVFSRELNIGLTPDQIMREYEDRMLRYYLTEAEPRPGASEFLKLLRKSGALTCVATASPGFMAIAALARHGLSDHMEFICSSSDLKMHKNDPEYYRLLAKRLGVPCDRCVLVDDALYALEGARAAGMGTLAIEDYFARANKDAIINLADIYIRGYQELIDGMI